MARSSLIPGFRFHPTDVELVMYYLKKKLLGKKISVNVVAEVNIYDYCPWDLPDKSSLKSGDLEWYFFCPKSKKYTSGGRCNRATEAGFWKATGKDRKVIFNERTVATIKTLVFHVGHAGKGQRTDWVMHEYRMEDEQLANAGVVQDTYVLCKIYEKSGAGPKNGAQYGAPFNEMEWDDDLASCSVSQAIVGSVGASNTTYFTQKASATTSMTGPGSSIVTFSANEPRDTQNYKKKGPANTNMTKPSSSTVTYSANKPTNTQQNGPATQNMNELGSSVVMFSADGPTNTLNYQQNGSAITELGSSVVKFSENQPKNTPNYKQKGPAMMNMSGPQVTHGLPVTEPGSSSVMLSTNEMPANDDAICLDDIEAPQEDDNGEKVKTVGPKEDDHIFDDLMNLINPDGFFTDGLGFTFDELLRPGDPDFENFY